MGKKALLCFQKFTMHTLKLLTINTRLITRARGSFFAVARINMPIHAQYKLKCTEKKHARFASSQNEGWARFSVVFPTGIRRVFFFCFYRYFNFHIIPVLNASNNISSAVIYFEMQLLFSL